MNTPNLDTDLLKHLIHKLGIHVTRYKKNKHDEVINLKPKGKCYGNVLLGTIIDPFLTGEEEEICNKHTDYGESYEMAKTLLELGFQVDIISHLRNEFLPRKKYFLYINFQNRFEHISRYLNDDCIKIVHLNFCHWAFNNYSALKRVRALEARRGIALSSLRLKTPNNAIEHCDYATTMGNDFTIGTYEYANKQIYKTNIPTYTTYDWPENKNFEKCKKNFLWFGSTGLVHKGLDLVLEAFADLPDYNLTVCGPIDEDEDFKKEYYKELFETPNIFTKGWVDISSQEFIDIANSNIALIFASCAEAFNGGTVTCMQAGIIPIVSLETAVDIDPSYGVLLKDSTIPEIKKNVIKVSNLPEGKLSNMARNSWEYARNNHTQERFHESYKKAILDIIGKELKKRKQKSRLVSFQPNMLEKS